MFGSYAPHEGNPSRGACSSSDSHETSSSGSHDIYLGHQEAKINKFKEIYRIRLVQVNLLELVLQACHDIQPLSPINGRQSHGELRVVDEAIAGCIKSERGINVVTPRVASVFDVDSLSNSEGQLRGSTSIVDSVQSKILSSEWSVQQARNVFIICVIAMIETCLIWNDWNVMWNTTLRNDRNVSLEFAVIQNDTNAWWDITVTWNDIKLR